MTAVYLRPTPRRRLRRQMLVEMGGHGEHSVTKVLRRAVTVVVVGHGLIHLLGVAEGLGLADVPQLDDSIGVGGGVLWLVAAVLILVSVPLIVLRGPRRWWAITLCAALVSQVAIVTSWGDARAGTLVNMVLVLVSAHGFLSEGPTSFHARWQRQATQALSDVEPAPAPLTDADLADLPRPLAAYIRRSGAVGHPRITSLYAGFRGRIRVNPDTAWMSFTGKQVNTFGPRPQRLFLMDATRAGLPVTVLHSYADATATMRAKVLSAVTVVDAAGPEMDRGESVTVFNDLVVLAPGAIVDAPVRWIAMDDRHVRGVFTNGDQTVSAELTFDDDSDLVDFVSEDRLRASADGKSFTRQTWSTPVTGHRDADGHRLITSGAACWRDPEGWFTYVELDFADIVFNLHGTEGSTTPRGRTREGLD